MVTQKCEHTDGTRNKKGNFFLPLTYILTPDFRPPALTHNQSEPVNVATTYDISHMNVIQILFLIG